MRREIQVILVLLSLPVFLFSQENKDSSTAITHEQVLRSHGYAVDSTFSLLFNPNDAFYTAQDHKINNFLQKYGYHPAPAIQVGVNLELAAIPFNSKMLYTLAGGTIVSYQSILTSHLTIGAYRRFMERKKIWLFAGAGFGTHGNRVLLNGRMPASFDSIANQYHKELSLHRSGFLLEPAVRFYWYPIQTSKFSFGLFANVAYDFAFDSRWKLGYFNQNGQFTSFRRIGKASNVQASREFGWALGNGLSFSYKFD